MNCAFCKKAVNDGYRPTDKDYEEYTIEINGVEVRIVVHTKCVPNVVCQYLLGKVKS